MRDHRWLYVNMDRKWRSCCVNLMTESRLTVKEGKMAIIHFIRDFQGGNYIHDARTAAHYLSFIGAEREAYG